MSVATPTRRGARRSSGRLLLVAAGVLLLCACTSPADSPRVARAAARIAWTMSLEEKAGQLLLIDFWDASGHADREVTPEVRAMIERVKPGGVVLYGGSIDTVEQTVRFTKELQAVSATPLFIAVDEEGGRVSRLTASGKLGAVKFPPALTVGSSGNPRLAFEEARVIGRELAALGINMDFAPVADVDTNPASPVIGDRSFSSNPQVAARMVSSFVRGLSSERILAVVKHFPGHGSTTTDTHDGSAVVDRTFAELAAVELVPFRSGIQAGAAGVMVAHVRLPRFDPDPRRPATFSPFVLEGLLRGRLHFRGLIITDALNMGAIDRSYTSGQAAVDSFAAGADLLMKPIDPVAAAAAIIDAVRSGRIPESRLDRSVERILRYKIAYGLIDVPGVTPSDPNGKPTPDRVFGSPEGTALVQEILDRARTHGAKSR